MASGFLPSPTSPSFRLGNARVPAVLLAGQGPVDGDLAAVDLDITEGRITAIRPAGSASDGRPEIKLDLGMVLPGFTELHTHIDKGHIWPRTPNPDGTFMGALFAVGADRTASWAADDVRRRMDFSLRCAYAHGTVALRTHLDSIPPQDEISFAVFDEVRADWKDRIALQAVALIGPDQMGDADIVAKVAATAARHGGLMGGAIAAGESGRAGIGLIIEAAMRHDLDIDIHVDETEDIEANSLGILAEEVLKRGFAGKVTAGHCCSLARKSPQEIDRVLDLVARAGISVVSLPMCNMYLQDRHRLEDQDLSSPRRTPRWRGVTLLHEMKARGIAVSISSDNTRDPFYAYGDLDMVEVWREATRILHLDHPVGDWPLATSATPAAVMGLDLGGIKTGMTADLVAVRARNWTEFFARPQSDRTVLRNGKSVSTDLPDYRELDDLAGFKP